jgi:internalin A
MAYFTQLSNLEDLQMWGNGVSNIAEVRNLTNLKELNLGNSKPQNSVHIISDITPLTNLKKLEKLYLNGNNITDVTPLLGLTNLQVLYVNDNPLSEGAVQALKNALPKCEIKF